MNRIALAFILVGGPLAAAAGAQALPPPVTTITSFGSIPPAPDAYSTSLRFGPEGLMYVWDGQQVWRQSGVNFDGFDSTPFGAVPSKGADAGPLNFSQDGTLLIGNGSGGKDLSGNSNGLFFAMKPSGGAAVPAGTVPVPNHFDLVPAPVSAAISNSATKFFVDVGKSNFTSEVDLFDYAASQVVPLIRNIPGASTSIAFDSANRLYVGIGFGDGQGEIRRFALPLLGLAASGNALDWTQGQLFNIADNNSGAGMFFDARGDLFVGGSSGVVVIDKNGASQVDNAGGYVAVSYNAVNDQLAVVPFASAATIYRAADFNVSVPPPVTWNVDSGGAWSDGSHWDQATAPNGPDQHAVLASNMGGPQTITLDVPVVLGKLTLDSPRKYFIAGSNSLTMQVTGTIATIDVVNGSHEIAAPLVLTSDTDITVANASDTLTLSGGVGGSGMLSKEGTGTLTISGANTYTGNTAVDGGTLRFQVSTGSASVASGSVVTVASGATLELAGVVSALGASSGNRAQIINDSMATGIIASGKNEVVGGIDGAGATAINAGSDLTADHIIQSALTIGGNATDHGTLTIAASSPDGDPLLLASSFPSSAKLELPFQVDAPLSMDMSGDITSVPEPTSSLLALLGGATLFFLRFHRRGRNL